MAKTSIAQKARDRQYLINIGISILSQGGTLLAGYLTVPLALGYLDPASYGLWLVISSVFNWLNSLDIGLGNGLRNRLTESLVNGQTVLAKAYVSTTYLLISAISLVVLLVIVIADRFVNWAQLLNAPAQSVKEFNQAFLLCAVFFSVRFICNLIYSVLKAKQQVGITKLAGFVSTLLVLISVFLLRFFGSPSLLYLCMAMAIPQVLVLVLLNLLLFFTNYRLISPSLSSFKLSLGRDVTELGLKFFVIQIVLIVVFMTDNVIITKLFGPQAVTPYNLAQRYMNLGTYLLNIILVPAWSAFTEANVLNDTEWITKTLKRLLFLWLISLLALCFLVLISSLFYKIWIGNKVFIPLSLTILMGVFVAQSTWNRIFANYINGVGKVSLLLRINVFVGIINIPLSIFLAKTLELGPQGVILATIFCMLLGSLFAPLQTYLLLSGRAKGIWNR